MKIEKELHQEIINITNKIRLEYPELSKYISEMPVNVSANYKGKINIKNLEDYYCSLVEVVNNYAKTHGGTEATITKDQMKKKDH